MKVIAVDDQFVNAKGKPMDTVPLVMMAATKIGERQGQELYKEMQKRGWDVKESAVMAITANELDTARRRTTGFYQFAETTDCRKNKIIRYLPNLTTSRGHLTLPTQCWFNIRKLNIG